MYDSRLHSFCSEFYSIESALELVVSRQGKPTTVRLEALRDEESGRCHIHAYIQERLTLQPTFPQSNDKFDRSPEDFRVWVKFSGFPWVDRETADDALREALGYLEIRCDQSRV